jgi:hypothetical protein
MALDVLLVPLMSAEPKRLFLSAGITIINYRNYLSIKSIQAIKCLKSWLTKDNIVFTKGLGLLIINNVL